MEPDAPSEAPAPAPVTAAPAKSTPRPMPAWMKNDWLLMGIILLVGLVLRVWFIGAIVHAPDFAAPQQDADVQDYYSRALVTGDWTVRPGENDPSDHLSEPSRRQSCGLIHRQTLPRLHSNLSEIPAQKERISRNREVLHFRVGDDAFRHGGWKRTGSGG